MRESARAYYEKHKEEIKARARAYKKEHRAHYTEMQKAWVKANPEVAKAIKNRSVEKHSDKKKARAKAWYLKNKELTIARAAARYAAKKPEILKKSRAYQLKNREKLSLQSKIRQPAYNARRRARSKVDENFRLRSTIGSRISTLVSQRRTTKCAGTMVLIGCDIQFLRDYLEARFLDGMNWLNYGEWHIDHRIPCASFDLREPDQQRQCFHYSNLRPMWGLDNIAKGAKMPEAHQAELV